jgi:hypothetical protein
MKLRSIILSLLILSISICILCLKLRIDGFSADQFVSIDKTDPKTIKAINLLTFASEIIDILKQQGEPYVINLKMASGMLNAIHTQYLNGSVEKMFSNMPQQLSNPDPANQFYKPITQSKLFDMITKSSDRNNPITGPNFGIGNLPTDDQIANYWTSPIIIAKGNLQQSQMQIASNQLSGSGTDLPPSARTCAKYFKCSNKLVALTRSD